MKTLIALLLVATGLGAAYWKVQHPDATLDDVKFGANATLERAKSGLAAFQSNSESNTESASIASAGAALVTGGAAASAVAASAADVASDTSNPSDAAIPASTDTNTSFDTTVIDGRLTDAERRMDAADRKLDGLAEELKTVTSSLGNLNDNVSELSSNVVEQNDEQTLTNIGTRIDSIDSRLTDLGDQNNDTIEELNAELTALADENTALSARLNTLSVGTGDSGETSLSVQVDKRLQEIESKLATANSDKLRLNGLIDRLNTTNEQLNALSETQNNGQNSDARVTQLEAALDETTAKTESLEFQLSQANDKIASMSEELEALKDQSGSNASVESLQAELTQQLQDLENRIASTNDDTTDNDINTLNSTLASTRQRIQLLESRVQNLPTDNDNAEAAQEVQSNLQEQIAAMETRLRELPQQTDPELLDTLNQVQQDVAELREREIGNGVEYRVYFGNGSVAISDETAVVLKSFIRQEQNRTVGVNIYGFTDRRGDAAFNQRLALQRATAVRSFLIQNGFDFTKIKSLSGLGEDAAAAWLDDGAEDADSRTVVLVADQP